MTERTFDRRIHYDDRSRDFMIRTLVAEVPIRSYTWGCPVRLDQGEEGACVGFGWVHEFAARPKPHSLVVNQHARDLYRAAQLIDPWPETPPEEGTAVLAGAKIAQEYGYLGEYRWCFSIDDLRRTVGNVGPVVMGTWWWTGMMETDANGFIHATGVREGGHAWLVNSYNVLKRRFGMVQSWGTSWGRNGTAYIHEDDMETLLMDEGEGCVPTQRLWILSLK